MDSNSTPQTPKAAPMAVSSLLSPPEIKKQESFTTPTHAGTPASSFSSDQTFNFATKNDPRPYASPPISPYTTDEKENNASEERAGESAPDPPLFESQDSAYGLPPGVPLFQDVCSSMDAMDLEESNAAIADHIHKTKANFEATNAPTHAEYSLALELNRIRSTTFKSTVFTQFNKDPKGYRAQVKEHNARYTHTNGITKRKPLKALLPAAPSTPTSKKIMAAMPRKAARTRRVPPKARPTSATQARSSGAATTRSKPPKATKSDSKIEVPFATIPDFCPPVTEKFQNREYLVDLAKKIDVKKVSPHPSPDNHPELAHLLTPAEQGMARALRWGSNQWLAQKRFFFEGKVNKMREERIKYNETERARAEAKLAGTYSGKDKEYVESIYRKTHAQDACGVDVNKASTLWQIFLDIGWQDDSFFEQFLPKKYEPMS